VAAQIKICSFTLDEYIERVQKFHGFAAPGVILGGFMVDLAYRHLPPEGLFDAICETEKCLPDAVQLLTPCTVGNGWLRVFDTGRFALSLYDKTNGQGTRVYVDPAKMEKWSEIKIWLFKLKTKKEQRSDLLMEQIKEAGATVCGWHPVKTDLDLIKRPERAKFAVCPGCREPYPAAHGEICLGCRGKLPYNTK
jgi:formylmethanofuran dehydrogenase subunit E